MSLFDSIKKAFHPTATSAPPAPSSGSDRNPSATAGPGAGAGDIPAAAPPRPVDWRVLFIGGDPRWFQLVARDIQTLQPGWMCQHAVDGDAARKVFATAASFDALVLDGRMANSAKLLAQIEQRRGGIVSLVRCDTSNKATLEQWKHAAAILVSEECDVAMMVSSLKRGARLREWMADQSIKRLLPMITKLPTAPEIHTQVTEHLESPNGSMITVARLISQDPVMSAKILQVVNSVQFGLANEVTDTADAVIILGVERIKSLILLAGVFSQYKEAECPGFCPEPIWSHSVQVGMLARTIAFAETKNATMAETAFTAGLLHDVGKLILAANLPDLYESVREMQVNQRASLREAEMKLMGTTHAEFAACLLATWGLPLPVLEAIAWHHEPQRSKDEGFSLLAAVHAANAFTHEMAGGGEENPLAAVNVEYLRRSGLGDCRNRWRQFCGLPAQTAEPTLAEQIQRRREVKEN